MPIYHYKCSKCDATQTETFSINVELTAPNCPQCKTVMDRIFNVASIQFKGSGWGRDKN